MSKIKMVGLDLDGTLLNDRKELTAYARDVICRAGVTVLVATGRPITGIPKELKEIPGMRYAVTANGGRILDMQYQKILYENLVPYEDAIRVVKIFEEYDTMREIYFDGQGYVRWVEGDMCRRMNLQKLTGISYQNRWPIIYEIPVSLFRIFGRRS